MTSVFQGLSLLALVAVEVSGILGSPRPGLAGSGLAVAAALAGFAVGSLGAIKRRAFPAVLSTVLLALLAASAGGLDWLQPGGPAVLGSFVASGAAAIRLPRRESVLVAVVALLALVVPAFLASGHTAGAVLLTGTGVLAFYAMGDLAHRLRVGQDLASRLLDELEASQAERAEAAALAERERIAREMHDVLAHSLSGLVLQLEVARLLSQQEGNAPTMASAIERALQLGKSGLAEARRAIGVLRDAELPGPEALGPLVADFERDAGIPCSLDVSGTARSLSAAARLAVYRVSQESLTNVRRHAHAERVEVRLVYEPEGTRLTVEDFASAASTVVPLETDTSNGNGGGYGISGMRERAELLGGRLEACRTAGGFRVELWVPS